MKHKANHPQWALDQRKPGTELRCIRGKYYLYACKSYYDKQAKKSKKKTGAYLGRVTEEHGLIPPRRRQIEIENDRIEAAVGSNRIEKVEPKLGQVHEYGLSAFITSGCDALLGNLKCSFPTMWNRILALAYCRLRCQSPMARVQDDFADSHLSQTLGSSGLAPRSLTDFLKRLGCKRDSMVALMRQYAGHGGNVIFDGTDILSSSAKMDFPRMSKTKLGGFDNVVNLMMGFSTQLMMPVYYRLLPGNVKDVTAFLSSVDEFGDKDMTVIGDKGFYSKNNIKELDSRELKYVIALRRDTAGLDYTAFDGHKCDGHFFYADRLIKYSTQNIDGHTVHLCFDAKHAAEEETDYLRRVDNEQKEQYTMDTYAAKAPHFGTLAIMVSKGITPIDAYNDYKSRCEVEQEIDVLKTDLDALTSYMQDNERLEAWMFINFIALHIFYTIRKHVVHSGLSSKLSTREAIRVLCRQRIVRINDQWRLAETSKKDKAILEALGVSIT